MLGLLLTATSYLLASFLGCFTHFLGGAFGFLRSLFCGLVNLFSSPLHRTFLFASRQWEQERYCERQVSYEIPINLHYILLCRYKFGPDLSVELSLAVNPREHSKRLCPMGTRLSPCLDYTRKYATWRRCQRTAIHNVIRANSSMQAVFPLASVRF